MSSWLEQTINSLSTTDGASRHRLPIYSRIDDLIDNNCLFNKNLRFIFIFVGIKDAVFLFLTSPAFLVWIV